MKKRFHWLNDRYILHRNFIIFGFYSQHMKAMFCPNFEICKLVTTEGFSGDEVRRKAYIDTWCTTGEKNWSACTRYITKAALNFCPDFVMPDTALSPDEIIDKFDELNSL